MSYIATGSSLLHQKLVFPCTCGCLPSMGQMYQPHPSQAYSWGEWQVRLCHKKIMVWQSPSIRLGRLPWDGYTWKAMASPVDVNWSIYWGWVKISSNMWVGMDVFLDRMIDRLMHASGGGIDIRLYMPVDSRLANHHDCSQNWFMVARPLGYEMGAHPSMSSSLMMNHHLLWHVEHSFSAIEGPTAANIRVA